jgi:hypothetical protein
MEERNVRRLEGVKKEIRDNKWRGVNILAVSTITTCHCVTVGTQYTLPGSQGSPTPSAARSAATLR